MCADEDPDAGRVEEGEATQVEADRMWHGVERLGQVPAEGWRFAHVQLPLEPDDDGSVQAVDSCLEAGAMESGEVDGIVVQGAVGPPGTPARPSRASC